MKMALLSQLLPRWKNFCHGFVQIHAGLAWFHVEADSDGGLYCTMCGIGQICAGSAMDWRMCSPKNFPFPTLPNRQTLAIYFLSQQSEG